MIGEVLAGISAAAQLLTLISDVYDKKKRKPTKSEIDRVRKRANTPIIRGVKAANKCIQNSDTIKSLEYRIQGAFNNYASKALESDFVELPQLRERLRKDVCGVLQVFKDSCNGNLPTKRLRQLWNQFGCEAIDGKGKIT